MWHVGKQQTTNQPSNQHHAGTISWWWTSPRFINEPNLARLGFSKNLVITVVVLESWHRLRHWLCEHNTSGVWRCHVVAIGSGGNPDGGNPTHIPSINWYILGGQPPLPGFQETKWRFMFYGIPEVLNMEGDMISWWLEFWEGGVESSSPKICFTFHFG